MQFTISFDPEGDAFQMTGWDERVAFHKAAS